MEIKWQLFEDNLRDKWFNTDTCFTFIGNTAENNLIFCSLNKTILRRDSRGKRSGKVNNIHTNYWENK